MSGRFVHLWVRGRALTLFMFQMSVQSTHPSGVLEGAPAEDSITELGDFNIHMGYNSVTWRGHDWEEWPH